jgi:hypothetical protein
VSEWSEPNYAPDGGRDLRAKSKGYPDSERDYVKGLVRARDEFERQRDIFKKALEWIAHEPDCPGYCECKAIANTALNRVEYPKVKEK